MSLKTLVGLVMLVAGSLAYAQDAPRAESSASEAALAQSADSEASQRIEELDLSMSMAREGQFGRIKGRDMQKLESAYGFIRETLSEVDSVSELSLQKQQSLTLAQSQFDDIIKAEDPNRKICKRIANTGTRLGALECLTVAERRARARASREMVVDAQRGFCVPGEGNPCS